MAEVFIIDSPSRFIDMTAAYLPSSPTVVKADATGCYVDMFTFTNTDTTAITVTVTDNQSSPLPVIYNLSIPADSEPIVVTFPHGGRLFAGGIRWSASTPSKIVGYFRLVQR